MGNEAAANAYEYLLQTDRESQEAKETFIKEMGQSIIKAAEIMGKCVNNGGKVLIFGNGGSAADSQHMAAEMVGRMLVDRRPLPAIALTTDTSNLTALGNDFGYDRVFQMQVEALAKKGDVAIGISTSGNSQNVILGMEAARKAGCQVIGLTGKDGGKMGDICDIHLNVTKGKNSSRIQESHIFAVHSLVDLVDRFFLKS